MSVAGADEVHDRGLQVGERRPGKAGATEHRVDRTVDLRRPRRRSTRGRAGRGSIDVFTGVDTGLRSSAVTFAPSSCRIAGHLLAHARRGAGDDHVLAFVSQNVVHWAEANYLPGGRHFATRSARNGHRVRHAHDASAASWPGPWSPACSSTEVSTPSSNPSGKAPRAEKVAPDDRRRGRHRRRHRAAGEVQRRGAGGRRDHPRARHLPPGQRAGARGLTGADDARRSPLLGGGGRSGQAPSRPSSSSRTRR